MLLFGNILTMSRWGQMEALYLEGNQIADWGSAQDMLARYPGVRSYTFDQITPGLHDAHTHPVMWGEQLEIVDLSGLNDPDQIAQAVAQRVGQLQPGQWVRGGGYLLDHYPDAGRLDRAAPHNPVFLQSRDRHSAWVNTLALQQAGITATTPDPAEGEILRDAQGEPTGYLLEAATALIRQVMPAYTADQLMLGLKDLARRGYTGVHHMGWSPLHLAESLGERLPVRLWWALDKGEWQGVQPGWRGRRLDVSAVKFFADGAIGSRTAWMWEPYADGSFGLPLNPLQAIESEGREALEAGFSLVTHAIGNRAVAEVLAIYRRLAPLWKEKRLAAPLRLEHVQHVRTADLPLFAGLPLALSIQPIHLIDDQRLVRHHLPDRVEEAFRFRDLWDTGLVNAYGSDAPVAPPDVLAGLEAAQQHALNPDQSVSAYQALWAFTRGGALAAGWPQYGRIAPGYPADLTLWDAGQPVGRVFDGVMEGF